MNEHQSFVNNLWHTVCRAEDAGAPIEESRQILLHAIYGYVAMRLPTKVSFTFINQACQEIDMYKLAVLDDIILSIIERAMNYDPVEINVVERPDKSKHLPPLEIVK